MLESQELLLTIKRLFKQHGLTYKAVAAALAVSEASIKRMFRDEQLSLQRLEQIAKLLGYSLAELVTLAARVPAPAQALSYAQEEELVCDPRRLLVAVCVLNHWSLAEISQQYTLDKAECLHHALALEKVGLLQVLPGDRLRLTVARDFAWLPHGPILRYFREQGLPDFLEDGFNIAQAEFTFRHGRFGASQLRQAQEELAILARRFAQLHEDSKSLPLHEKTGVGLLLALRPWEPKAFVKLRREPSA